MKWSRNESTPRNEGDSIGFSDETSDCDESIDITDTKSKFKWKDYQNVFMNYIQRRIYRIKQCASLISWNWRRRRDMSFLDIKDPGEMPRSRIIYRWRSDWRKSVDRQRDLQETFQPVVASNQKMAQDIIKDLILITEGLQEINRNLKAKKGSPRPKIGSKQRFVSDYGPLAEKCLQKYSRFKVIILR